MSNVTIWSISQNPVTYRGERIPVLGEAAVEVQHNEQNHQLSLIVVKGQGHNQFERDWLMHFQRTIGLATLENAKAKVDVLLKRYEVCLVVKKIQ